MYPRHELRSLPTWPCSHHTPLPQRRCSTTECVSCAPRPAAADARSSTPGRARQEQIIFQRGERGRRTVLYQVLMPPVRAQACTHRKEIERPIESTEVNMISLQLINVFVVVISALASALWAKGLFHKGSMCDLGFSKGFMDFL